MALKIPEMGSRARWAESQQWDRRDGVQDGPQPSDGMHVELTARQIVRKWDRIEDGPTKTKWDQWDTNGTDERKGETKQNQCHKERHSTKHHTQSQYHWDSTKKPFSATSLNHDTKNLNHDTKTLERQH